MFLDTFMWCQLSPYGAIGHSLYIIYALASRVKLTIGLKEDSCTNSSSPCSWLLPRFLQDNIVTINSVPWFTGKSLTMKEEGLLAGQFSQISHSLFARS